MRKLLACTVVVAIAATAATTATSTTGTKHNTYHPKQHYHPWTFPKKMPTLKRYRIIASHDAWWSSRRNLAYLSKTGGMNTNAINALYRFHMREAIHAKQHIRKILQAQRARDQMLWCRAGECIKTLIRRIWGGASSGAITVAQCESGLKAYPYEGLSITGQYTGVFQLGTSERAQWGRGIYRSPDPYTAIKASAYEQVMAGYRLYKDLGWGPWQCSPYGGLNW